MTGTGTASPAESFVICVDCGRLLPPGKAFVSMVIPLWADTTDIGKLICTLEKEIVCSPCGRLRTQIEGRIKELLIGRDPSEVDPEEIYADLERFGVPRDLVDAAALRLKKCRERVPEGKT